MATADPSFRIFTSTTTNRGGGTWAWQAPELFRDDEQNARNTRASDIYALGMVAYEVRSLVILVFCLLISRLQIFSGMTPFYNLAMGEIMTGVLSGRRPSRPSMPNLSDAIWDLMEKCWDGKACRRPAATEAVNALEEALRESDTAITAPVRNDAEQREPWDLSFVPNVRGRLYQHPFRFSSQSTFSKMEQLSSKFTVSEGFYIFVLRH